MCHGDIWCKKRKWSKLIAEVQESTGHPHCAWKGRMAAWWVAEGIQAVLAQIRTLMTDSLRLAIDNISDNGRRGQALSWLDELRTTLAEMLWDKLKFWDHIPWKIVGVYYCCAPFHGAMDRAKQILRECIEEYDKAVQAGLLSSLHRVARRVLDPCRTAGMELREWLADTTGKHLGDFVQAFFVHPRICVNHNR